MKKRKKISVLLPSDIKKIKYFPNYTDIEIFENGIPFPIFDVGKGNYKDAVFEFSMGNSTNVRFDSNVRNSKDITSIDNSKDITYIDKSKNITSMDNSKDITSIDKFKNITSTDNSKDTKSIANSKDITGINNSKDIKRIDNLKDIKRIDNSKDITGIDNSNDTNVHISTNKPTSTNKSTHIKFPYRNKIPINLTLKESDDSLSNPLKLKILSKNLFLVHRHINFEIFGSKHIYVETKPFLKLDVTQDFVLIKTKNSFISFDFVEFKDWNIEVVDFSCNNNTGKGLFSNSEVFSSRGDNIDGDGSFSGDNIDGITKNGSTIDGDGTFSGGTIDGSAKDGSTKDEGTIDEGGPYKNSSNGGKLNEGANSTGSKVYSNKEGHMKDPSHSNNILNRNYFCLLLKNEVINFYRGYTCVRSIKLNFECYLVRWVYNNIVVVEEHTHDMYMVELGDERESFGDVDVKSGDGENKVSVKDGKECVNNDTVKDGKECVNKESVKNKNMEILKDKIHNTNILKDNIHNTNILKDNIHNTIISKDSTTLKDNTHPKIYKINVYPSKVIDVKYYKNFIAILTSLRLLIINLETKTRSLIKHRLVKSFALTDYLILNLYRGGLKFIEMEDLQNTKTVKYKEWVDDIQVFEGDVYYLSKHGIYTVCSIDGSNVLKGTGILSGGESRSNVCDKEVSKDNGSNLVKGTICGKNNLYEETIEERNKISEESTLNNTTNIDNQYINTTNENNQETNTTTIKVIKFEDTKEIQHIHTLFSSNDYYYTTTKKSTEEFIPFDITELINEDVKKILGRNDNKEIENTNLNIKKKKMDKGGF